MGLQPKGGERGYAMAALLVSIAVMAVLMSVAMPAYRHLARREKEAELVFRGEQYARAVALFRAKNGNTFPPSIDVLVQGKYLRKKYLDPMAKDGEFRIVPVGNPTGQNPGQNPGGGRGPNPPAGGRGNPPQGPGGNPQTGGPGQTGGVSGGMMGVASKSTETSIRIYKGQTRYDLWPFTFNMVNRPGGNMPGANAPGGPGGRPQPGGPGRGVGPGRGTGPGRGGPAGGRGPGRGGPGMGVPGGQPGRGMVPDFGGRRGGGN
jgi:type II secretory pathway pseudopilin PulG